MKSRYWELLILDGEKYAAVDRRLIMGISQNDAKVHAKDFLNHAKP